MKKSKILGLLMYFFICTSVWGCKKGESIEAGEKRIIQNRTDANKLGIRFNKNDSGSFYFLIKISRPDTLKERDSLYHGNIFLIQPKRYQ